MENFAEARSSFFCFFLVCCSFFCFVLVLCFDTAVFIFAYRSDHSHFVPRLVSLRAQRYRTVSPEELRELLLYDGPPTDEEKGSNSCLVAPAEQSAESIKKELCIFLAESIACLVKRAYTWPLTSWKQSRYLD